MQWRYGIGRKDFRKPMINSQLRRTLALDVNGRIVTDWTRKGRPLRIFLASLLETASVLGVNSAHLKAYEGELCQIEKMGTMGMGPPLPPR
jgi:hypothetical protein